MQYRQVPCTYQPQYKAPNSPEATPYYGNVPGGSLRGASGWTERKGYHHRHVTSTNPPLLLDAVSHLPYFRLRPSHT